MPLLRSLVVATMMAAPVAASAQAGDDTIFAAFAANCLSPYLTADQAVDRIGRTGARLDYYDRAPASDVAPSQVARGTDQRPVTPGTDRRCDVAFDGDHGMAAAEAAIRTLASEGILTLAPLPETHATAALPGTTLLAARALNPARVAVVHTGTRPGPTGPETFLSVERLTPDASREAMK